jgi:N-acetylneuraminate synthase
MISHLDKIFPEYTAGYSDHVPPDDGMITLLNSVVNGSKIIEKHFTLNKSLEGNDHYHAMDPGDVETFRENIHLITSTTGRSTKRPISAETDSRKYARRSLVAATDINQGEKITEKNLAIKRPGTGISPTLFDVITGRKAQKQISGDDILTWDMV